MRLDKWLWAARFFKTRSLASDEIAKSHVRVNDSLAKASRELHVGDVVELRLGPLTRTVIIQVLSDMRGPAKVAQTLYQETPESLAARTEVLKARQLKSEPSQSIEHGRPTKRDRRKLVEWTRWSASAEDKPPR